jgi:Putative MetA-pathway of phenol degradation
MRRLLIPLCIVFAFICPEAIAQTSCTPQAKLFCLVPNQLGTKSDEFTALNEAVGTVVSDLPLASPASGVIYTIDLTLKLPVPANTTLGPILTQRPETVGRHKAYFAAVYQYFRFEDVDGTSLKALPSVTKTSNLAFVTANRLNLTVHQTVGYFTFGLTSRVDVSVAVPILDIQEQFTSVGSKIILTSSSTPPTPINITNSGSASGIGDVVVAAKATLWKPTAGGLAAGIEIRTPSGDEQNFLGSGTVGVKPYLSFAYGKKLSFHGNVAYQVNGDTNLVTSSSGGKGQLPSRLFYSGGVDWGFQKWITLAVDALAERVFDANRIEIGTSAVNADNFRTIVAPSPINSYNRTDGSAGIKLKPYRNILMTGNVLIKLDQGGLRTRIVPLAGLSYTF